MQVSWTAIKTFVDDRSLSIQWVDTGEMYWLKAIDGTFSLECMLNKSNTNDDLSDFETNYKDIGNKSPVLNTKSEAVPPFGAKTIIVNGVTKKLYARNTGMQFAVTTGANTLEYTMTYTWAKLLGAEIINCEALDYTDFKVYDTAAGTYSGVPNALLNQFGFSVNLNKDFYQRISPYDADVYVGMVLKLTYNSKSDKTIGVNLILNEVKS